MISVPITIPPLENGDRLSRAEFERRYAAMPQLRKAELIEGIVYLMASPLHVQSHGQPHAQIMTWLGLYQASHPQLVLAVEPTVRLDPDNEPQPDAVLFIPGRHARISPDDYIEGPPELIAEIAASCVSLDLHDKKRAYRRSEVQEYLVWRTLEQQLDWFHLQADDYVPLDRDPEGIVRSQVFPGLCLAVPALLAGDLARVLAVLNQGLAQG
ncbi:MAG: Uma2 family endonuclease [Synechococcales cyanobacterium]